MFDQLKSLGAVAGLLKDRDRLQRIAGDVRKKLERSELEGQAGGGAVRATVTGSLEVKRVKLDAALASGLSQGGEAKAQAERLIAEAVNDGVKKAQELAKETIAKEAKALGLGEVPGLSAMLGSM